jgi:DNA-directed RNA polymerase specialized sigma24 family protein
MPFQPKWHGPFERYARKFAQRHHWRVCNVLDDPEDVLQECAWKFVQCCKVYGDTIDNPAWLMQLYKRALIRHFDRLALRDKAARLAKMAARELQEVQAASEGYLFETLVGASRELRQVLQLFCCAPADLLDLMLPTPQYRFSLATEQRISRSWCRLARLDTVREDLVSELRGLVS